MKNTKNIKEQLQTHGFRATKARIDVLIFLETQQHPVGIEVVAKKMTQVNVATLYRIMEAFVEKGLVQAHDLGHGHRDYEIAAREHHHHAVCESCGYVEDVFPCKKTCAFERSVEQSSKEFKKILHHATTFFGICKQCA